MPNPRDKKTEGDKSHRRDLASQLQAPLSGAPWLLALLFSILILLKAFSFSSKSQLEYKHIVENPELAGKREET